MSFAKVLGEMLNQNHTGRNASQRMMGAMIAVVVDNVDPEDRYRVRVAYPWLASMYNEGTASGGNEGKVQSFWARIAAGGSGGEFGQFWLPEVNDEVVVIFQEGDFERPILIGGMWNGKAQSPRDITYGPDDVTDPIPNNQQAKANDFRFNRSRSGHHLMFKDREGEGAMEMRSSSGHTLFLDDASGAEKIRMYDMNRTQWFEIDVSGKLITLETDTGDILIKAKNTITVDCTDLVVNASKTIKVESGTSSEWKAGSTIKWESSDTSLYKAGCTLTIQGGPRIDLNP